MAQYVPAATEGARPKFFAGRKISLTDFCTPSVSTIKVRKSADGYISRRRSKGFEEEAGNGSARADGLCLAGRRRAAMRAPSRKQRRAFDDIDVSRKS
jgi:hypothetical protein